MEKKHNYLYVIVHNPDGRFYVGKHSTDKDDLINDGYMGSGVLLNAMYEAYKQDGKDYHDYFTKGIICDFPTEELAFKAEARVVNQDFLDCPLTLNLVPGGEGSLLGYCVVRKKDDPNSKPFKVKTDDPRIGKELISIAAGFLPAMDKRYPELGYKQVTVEEYQRDENLIHPATGHVMVKDKDGNVFQTSVNDPKWISKEYKSIVKDTVAVKDKDGNKFRCPSDSQELANGTYTPVAKDRYIIRNQDGTYSSLTKEELEERKDTVLFANTGKRYLCNVNTGKTKMVVAKDAEKLVASGEWIYGRSLKSLSKQKISSPKSVLDFCS